MVTFILFIKKLYSVKHKLLNLKKFVFFFNYRIYLHILPALPHFIYVCIYSSYSSTFNLMSLKKRIYAYTRYTIV